MTTEHIVMQRAPFTQWNACQTTLCGIGRFADCFWHFASLAVAKTHAAFLIAHHHKRSEAETTATLDHLGHPIDVHQFVGKLTIAFLALASAALSSGFMCHG
jgi:hypothetical protein